MSFSFKRFLSISFMMLAAMGLVHTATAQQGKGDVVHFVYTSDQHYGLTKKIFQGDSNVTSHQVNAALVRKINALPQQTLPDDGGVGAGKVVGAIDALLQTGDIANRMEPPSQTATASWAQFTEDYLHGLTVKSHDGKAAQVLPVPGNHDLSDAIGYYRPQKPATDPGSVIGVYNLVMHPRVPKTAATFDYKRDMVHYSRDIDGVHFVFVTLWPDSLQRIWMARDLANIPATTPVVIFAHDPPAGEAKHFTNPKAPHDINNTDKFENLLPEQLQDQGADSGTAHVEQRAWVAFLKQHPNIKAYFHGHVNYTEYYDYRGPDKDVLLPSFRVDSPMKGSVSSKDETKLSFELLSLNTKTMQLTVRECLWNANPAEPNSPVVFGVMRTIELR